MYVNTEALPVRKGALHMETGTMYVDMASIYMQIVAISIHRGCVFLYIKTIYH